MKKIRYNKSKTYLLPLLSEYVILEPLYFKNINTYIFDDKTLYNNSIFVFFEYKKGKNAKIEKYEQELVQSMLFQDIIYSDNYSTCFVFNFPKKFIGEYYLFLQGKYSEYSNYAKTLIVEFYTELYNGNLNAIDFLMTVKQVLFKDEKLKQKIEKDLGVVLDSNAELTSIMNMRDETLTIKKEEENIYSDVEEKNEF